MYVHTYVHTPMYIRTYGTFHKKLDDEQWSNCVRTVTDRALTVVRTVYVRTGVVCAYTFFSLADAFAIGLWLLPLYLEMKFVTFLS